jgi:hypothetical protein
MGILLGLTMIRNLNIFVKINTFGVIFIFMIIFFIIGVGVYAFTNTDFVYSQPLSPTHPGSPAWIKLFSGSFGPLMGILGGGYYLHNITLPIVRNSAKPENNVRDVFIGYLMVFLSYSVCGVMGYYGFSGTYFTDTLHENEIKSNCLLMLPSSNVFATIIRFCTFGQLLAAMCLLFAVQRSQIFLVVFGSEEKAAQQPLRTIALANFLILVAPFLLAIFYPQVGKLAGYLGSFSALGCIYVLPTLTYLKSLQVAVDHPLLAEAIKHNRYALLNEAPTSEASPNTRASPVIQL